MSKAEILRFPEPDPDFQLNHGFRPGMSDNPPYYGTIPQPVGAPDCLKGWTFVISGTLPSMRREEAKMFIQKYGGRVTGSISSKTDILLRGCIEVGPSKMQQARSRRLKIIDEAGLFEIVRSTGPEDQPGAESSAEEMESEDDVQILDPPKLQGGLFAEKYRPVVMSDLVGNLLPIKALRNWLENFGEDKKAALLYGPPGCGKTTAAHLILKEAGYHTVEFNASDTRSKKMVENELVEIFDTMGFAKGSKNALILDELDGMSSGDRGGLNAIIAAINRTRIPVICILNEMNDQKFTPLTKVCTKIEFKPLPPPLVAQRLEKVAAKEGKKLKPAELAKIAQMANGDLRAALNNLQFWSGEKGAEADKVTHGCQEALQALYTKDLTVDERMDAFFVDYSMMPLYMLDTLPCNNPRSYAEALDWMSMANTIDNAIMGQQRWELLPVAGLLSTAGPSAITKMKNPKYFCFFPSWFGKNSKRRRLTRNTIEVTSKSNQISSDSFYDYDSTFLSNYIWGNSGKAATIDQAFDLMDELGINADDCSVISELADFGLGSIAHSTPAKLKKLEAHYRSLHPNKSTKTATMQDSRADYFISSSIKKRGRK